MLTRRSLLKSFAGVLACGLIPATRVISGIIPKAEYEQHFEAFVEHVATRARIRCSELPVDFMCKDKDLRFVCRLIYDKGVFNHSEDKWNNLVDVDMVVIKDQVMKLDPEYPDYPYVSIFQVRVKFGKWGSASDFTVRYPKGKPVGD